MSQGEKERSRQHAEAFYNCYKFWKDLALLYIGTHGFELAHEYTDKSKPEREQMVFIALTRERDQQ